MNSTSRTYWATIGGWARQAASVLTNKDNVIVIVIGFLLSTLVTVSVDRYFKSVDEQTTKIEKIETEFRTASLDFDILVARYVHALVEDKKVDPNSRQALIANLIRQKQLIEAVSEHLPGSEKPRLREYIQALEDMNDIIPKSDDVLQMRDFWEDASRIVTIRQEIERKLRS